MDKSCRSFFFWICCSGEQTLAWLLAIVAVTLSRPLEIKPKAGEAFAHKGKGKDTSTFLSPFLFLMKCDGPDRRDLLREGYSL